MLSAKREREREREGKEEKKFYLKLLVENNYPKSKNMASSMNKEISIKILLQKQTDLYKFQDMQREQEWK